jgi:hypothetical protein
MTGKDAVCIVDAEIEIDGHLVFTLSNGKTIDAGLLSRPNNLYVSTNSGSGSLGIFATTTALQTSYPAASNSGYSAVVGSVAPYAMYISDGQNWVSEPTWTTDELRLVTPSGAEVSLALGNRTITASEAAVLIDNGKLIKANHATVAIVLTIDSDATVGWSANEILTIWQQGAASVSFAAGAGVTLRSPASVSASEQYGTIAAMRVGANEWTLL